MDQINRNIKWKIIPNKVVDWIGIEKSIQLYKMIYMKKHQIDVLIQSRLLLCNEITKIKVYSNKIKKETYQEYLDKIKSRDPIKDQWIYNIIDGFYGPENIIYKDNKCIIIPSYT